MTSTKLAGGKKLTQKTGSVTWSPPSPEPLVRTIDFKLNSSITLQTIPAQPGQPVILLVRLYPEDGPLTSDDMTFVQILDCSDTHMYVSTLRPKANRGYSMRCGSGTDSETKTANGSIEVSGGGDDERLRGPRGNAVRRRVSRSTRR
jgi:hypothetical protein